jgi:hypothetical protein
MTIQDERHGSGRETGQNGTKKWAESRTHYFATIREGKCMDLFFEIYVALSLPMIQILGLLLLGLLDEFFGVLQQHEGSLLLA